MAKPLTKDVVQGHIAAFQAKDTTRKRKLYLTALKKENQVMHCFVMLKLDEMGIKDWILAL